MSKNDKPSKYLSSFYSKPPAQNQPNAPARPQNPLPGSSSPKPSFHDADKFKNPADFFKSSQSLVSQSFSSQAKSSQLLKRTSFGGGSTHEMLSQSFQPKKPVTGQMNVPSKHVFTKPISSSKPVFPKPGPSFNTPFPAPQRKPYSVLDQNAASTKALELQWTTKMRQAQKAGMEAQKLQGIGHQEKRNLVRGDSGKSPMGKSLWADASFTKTDATCKNQQNDPWYSNDVWGDDLSVEAVDECLRVACTQEAKKSAEHLGDNTMSSWMNESWASPDKFPTPPLKTKPSSSVKTALFTDKKEGVKEKGDDFMALLSGDPSFMSFLDIVESQQKPSSSTSSSKAFTSSGGMFHTTQAFSSQARSTSSQIHLRTQIQPTHPSTQLRKSVPLSERLPVGASGNRSSFVIKAKEYESPSKNEGLTLSQRKLQKPTKSLPSPTPVINKHQTEWLRGQLEKITSEFSTLKEDVQVKEGESKLLREKLKTAEEEVKKHKLEKAKELETLREAFENKVKQLERQLEATQVQAIFKAKEAESSLEKYRELKTVSVRTPEPPAVNHSFKNLSVVGSRPGESSKTILVDETASTNEIIDETFDIPPTPTKKDLELMIEGTPEKCMFDDSPVSSPAKVEVDGFGYDGIYDKETQSEVTPVSTICSPTEFVFSEAFLEKNSVFVKVSDKIVHGVQPKKELNHFLMPPMEYLHHALLQTEFSEQELENYTVRRPTLVELWGTSYDAFGETVLNDYEKAEVGDTIPADPARSILAKSRYFTSLEDVHGVLTTLSTKSRWGPPERSMAKSIVDLATAMTRELYATLGDPRFLQTTYTIYDRDPKILKDLKNSSELADSFDPSSPERWRNESYVELRRCLVFVGFLCSVDHMTTRYIVNPKARKRGKTSDFYPPTDTSKNIPHKSKTDNDVALKIILKEGERNRSELKLMQMYRDLHSKKLTIVSELVSTFMPKDHKILQPPKVSDGNVGSDLPINNASSSADDALKAALEHVKQIVEFRTDFSPNSQLKEKFETNPSFEEYNNFLGELDLALDATDMQDMVSKIQGLNPKKMYLLKQLTEKPKVDVDSGVVINSRDLVKLPQNIVESANSDVSSLNSGSGGGIFSAPVNKCITNLEKQMMNLALNNISELRAHVRRSIDSEAPCDLDVTRYIRSSPDVDMEKSRKRKISVEDPGSSKVMKVAEYRTPPFDKTLYSQIQKHEPEEDDAIILETQTQVLPLEEDDQVAKFEKREEIAELKRKMLAEEREMETKHNHPLTSRHSLAPSRLTGRHSPSCEESADREMVMEIEKMFQSQVKPDVLEESVWSSSESDGEGEERRRTLSVNSEDDVEIEFIPDLVRNFHHKLKNAGLLELLCEVFKEGGVLRFTHRLNGVMLGTVLMLQKIVMYQRKEVEPYCSKMATIIREILYARPSPRIVLEVNVLLRYAVGIQGFTKMLCHNASQDTFVIRPEKVYFTRGACLLETICIIVTYATEDDTDLQIYFEISLWVYRIICSQKKHMTSLYEQHNANRRRCMCITALNNTMVMIYHRALSLYRSQYETHAVNIHRKETLENIFICGLQVLRLVYSYGSFSFLFSIKTQYHEYRQLLVWLKEMHEDDVFYKNFNLSISNLFIVTELLKDLRNPNPIPENASETVSGSFFGKTKHWPYNLHNTESLINANSSESEDD